MVLDKPDLTRMCLLLFIFAKHIIYEIVFALACGAPYAQNASFHPIFNGVAAERNIYTCLYLVIMFKCIWCIVGGSRMVY